MAKKEYTEDKIQTLNALEHIRLRPGMYIGRLGNGTNYNDGVYILIKEIVDNCIDEFIMGYGSKIEIMHEKNIISIRDYGRGIPLGKVVECVSQINTGAKYNSDVFQFSIGLNGVGTKAVNALAKFFIVRSIRSKKFKQAEFKEGILVNDFEGDTDEVDGTFVSFSPSEKVFPKIIINDDFMYRRVSHYAYLNKGLTLFYNDRKFYSRNGLKDFLEEEVSGENIYNVVYYNDERLELAFSHIRESNEQYFSFANGQYTIDGGTHLSAFKEGFLKAVNEYFKKSYTGNDVRGGLLAAIAIKVNDPIFESQTKNKLANTDIRSSIIQKIRDFFTDFLYKNKDIAELIEDKIKLNEKLRKGIQDLKKHARDKVKKANFKIPKLKDCKNHFSDGTLLGSQSQIFLTEGDSATGSMIHCRDVMTQALFALRGKPLNCHNMSQEIVYKNEELFYIMKALNIENDIESLRYNKVIIATDADQDGLHIRNLLLTYFLTYFPTLVQNDHLYILETPLFRVRNKKETIYCFDDKEQEQAIKKIGASAEITRFKGLGEISPKEFKPFISDDTMKLIQVSLEHRLEIPKLLDFYMGKNSKERKDFIVHNLI